ncbi:MAG: hypothetical protein ACRDJC_17055 [Thermomicrobiales bacterium]
MDGSRIDGWLRRRYEVLLEFRGESRSRRDATSFVIGLALGGALGHPNSHEVEAKSCPTCRRKKNGKCKKKKPDGTACGACRECQAGRCVSRCGSNEDCFGGECLNLGGDCSGDVDFCATGQIEPCAFNGAAGQCVKTNDGSPFCASAFSCNPGSDLCQSDADCRKLGGVGPHVRCVAECMTTLCPGQAACVTLAGEDQ